MNIDLSPLGKETSYINEYDSNLIFQIPRATKRKELGIVDRLPFFGYDIWNAYELSWLRNDGKPQVAIAEIIYNCDSEFIVESKSLKLYLNSFNSTIFNSIEDVKNTIKSDLSDRLKTNVIVKFYSLNTEVKYINPTGLNIDDFYRQDYQGDKIMVIEDLVQKEKLFTNLLKSNCPVTGQPDWATLMITYSGQKIDYASLIKYIISLRSLNEFHEQCVEKIYMTIYENCHPNYLALYARYTRRGGIDINPYRCSEETTIPDNYRVCRQ